MSRISNLSNLRIPHFNSWKTVWYENNKNYSYLFFRDFQLFQYLKGLFYRLKMLTDDFYFNNLTNNCFFIKVNIYLYKFQIKKFFLSFFMDQYLLYNFILRRKRIKFNVSPNFNISFFSSFLNIIQLDFIFYNFVSFFILNKKNIFLFNKNKDISFSVLSLRSLQKIKKKNKIFFKIKKKEYSFKKI